LNKLIVERKANKLIRTKIAEVLGTSSKDLRNYYTGELATVLNKLDFSSPYIPTEVFKSDLFSSKDINDFLDYLYIDLMILYNDAFTIRDYIDRIRALFVATIIPQIITAGEISTKVRNLKKLESTKYSFTDSIFESFNSLNNQYNYDDKLTINPGAGILRLPGIERNYATPETSNIRIEMISEGLIIIDQSDINNIYNNDYLTPFYINAITGTSPVNNNSISYEFEEESGLICDIILTFPDIVPVSRISFTQFSDATIKVIGVHSSLMVNKRVGYSVLEVINLKDINYDNNEIELNFDSTSMRELHIFIKQEKYKSTKNTTKIATYKKVTDYINYCAGAMASIDSSGFTENKDLNLQIKEIHDSIKTNTKFPTDMIMENIRSYTMGLFNLKVMNVIYRPGGIYQSPAYSVDGNIDSISYVSEGETQIVIDNHIIAATLFGININNNNIYLGETNTENEVTDIIILEPNLIYTDGIAEIKTSHPLKLYTHFLPETSTMIPLHFYMDDRHIVITDYIITNSGHYAIIELKSENITMYNWSEGDTIILTYVVPDIDYYGLSYSTSEANLLNRIGKPNIFNNNILNIENAYLYSKFGEEEISYKESEYTEVLISGELYYSVGIGKGEIESIPDVIKINTNPIATYLHNSICTVPATDMYCGVFNESIAPIGNKVIDTKQYLEYNTIYPYVKNSIKIYNDQSPVLDIVEYRDDILGDIVPLTDLIIEDKHTIYILSGNVTEFTSYYIPIRNDYAGLTLTNNIAGTNISDMFTKVPASGIELSRYPYIDMDIVNSTSFDLDNGIFTYNSLSSIIYEPISVTINGTKATNITRYRTSDMEIEKKLKEITREGQYMYYISADGKLIPNTDISGNIVVQYYIMSDSLKVEIQMAKSTLYRDDITPELYDFTILTNTKR